MMKEEKEELHELQDKETRLRILKMCSSCKFYKGKCMKNRAVRECAVKWLKNKD